MPGWVSGLRRRIIMTAGNTHTAPDYIAASITLIARSLARSLTHSHTHVEFWLHHFVIALTELRLNGQILSLFVRCPEHDEIFALQNDRAGSNQSKFCERVLFPLRWGHVVTAVDRYMRFARFA